jgi:protein-tyrosine kinase
MSRVDEALRRSLENRAGEGADAAPQATVGLDDPAELSAEPFPLELPERRAAHPAAVRPVPLAAAPPAAPVPTPESPATPGQASGLITRVDAKLAEKLVIGQHTMPLSREQYRRLAATLHHAQAASELRVVMIGSALPGEGKTLTAANLALTFSESYKRSVLIIDADLRRPSQHQVFQIDNEAGLSDGLAAVAEEPLRVRQLSQYLALLPAGRATSDPMAGLTSPRMQRLVSEARALFDWVIIDTPPVGLLPDANLLGSLVDGAVMVIRAGATPYDIVERAIEAIGRPKLLGVVLNRAEESAAITSYDYYGAYYHAQGTAGS